MLEPVPLCPQLYSVNELRLPPTHSSYKNAFQAYGHCVSVVLQNSRPMDLTNTVIKDMGTCVGTNSINSLRKLDFGQGFLRELRKKYPAVVKTDDILKLLIMKFSYCSADLCQGILCSLPYSY